MSSRSLVRIQWVAIAFLIIAYILKPCPPCDEMPSSTRTVYVTLHDTVKVQDTVPTKKTDGYKRVKKILVAPPANYAHADSGDTICNEYIASTSDSLVDIEVSMCSVCPIDTVVISHRMKGIKQIHTIDSIPYPVEVGIRRGIYLGLQTTAFEGFGPKIDYATTRNIFSYHYDAIKNTHSAGVTFMIWGGKL